MSIVIGIIVGLLVLMALVVVHELGHFFMARKNGVEVEEFGIGFPPRAIAWRKVDGKWKKIPKGEWEKTEGKGLIISVNWLPIGGFCKMKDESDAATKKGSFGRASFWGKTRILFGGVIANWLIAMIILTILAWTGMPHFIEGQFQVESDTRVSYSPVLVNSVIEESPADMAGLTTGDELVRLGGGASCVADEPCPEIWEVKDILIPEDVSEFNASRAGQLVQITFIRSGEEQSVNTTLNEVGSEYMLGVTMSQDSMPMYRSTWSAPVVGVATTVQLTGETFKGLGQMVWNFVSGLAMQVNFDATVREEGAANLEQAGESVSGPVGIIGYIFPAFVSSGMTNLAYLAAIISISLACMNVLPIPALDGGRWLLIVIYKLRKKKLTTEIEERIVGRAFMVLIGLIVLITILDITRFFG